MIVKQEDEIEALVAKMLKELPPHSREDVERLRRLTGRDKGESIAAKEAVKHRRNFQGL